MDSNGQLLAAKDKCIELLQKLCEAKEAESKSILALNESRRANEIEKQLLAGQVGLLNGQIHKLEEASQNNFAEKDRKIVDLEEQQKDLAQKLETEVNLQKAKMQNIENAWQDENKKKDEKISKLTEIVGKLTVSMANLSAELNEQKKEVHKMEEAARIALNEKEEKIVKLMEFTEKLGVEVNGLKMEKIREESMNHWDAEYYCDGLFLVEPSNLVVQCLVDGRYAFVLAKLAYSSYFEVKIIEMRGWIFVGLAPESMALNKAAGRCPRSYAYFYDGRFLGHKIDGCEYWDRTPFVDGEAEFEEGDTVGCGVDPNTREIIYTKNGERLDTTDLLVDLPAGCKLFPCVSLETKGDMVAANFGQRPFMYDPAKTNTCVKNS